MSVYTLKQFSPFLCDKNFIVYIKNLFSYSTKPEYNPKWTRESLTGRTALGNYCHKIMCVN